MTEQEKRQKLLNEIQGRYYDVPGITNYTYDILNREVISLKNFRQYPFGKVITRYKSKLGQLYWKMSEPGSKITMTEKDIIDALFVNVYQKNINCYSMSIDTVTERCKVKHVSIRHEKLPEGQMSMFQFVQSDVKLPE